MFGFSGSQLGIGVQVALHDKFSATSRRVEARMKQMAKLNKGLAMQAVRDYRNQALGISAGTALASRQILSTVQEQAQFSKTIKKTAIVAEGAWKKAGLKKLALGLAETFRTMPQEASEALFENVKAGVTKNLGLITRYQMAVAKAVDEPLSGEGGVAKGLLNIANSMQIPYERFAEVANAVTVAANKSQASVLDLNESLQYTANTASKAGYSLQETLAGLAMLSQMGIRGSSAGTAMSNLIRYSTRAGGQFATKKQVTALKMMGLDPKQLRGANGELLGLVNLMDLFTSKLKGKTGTEQVDILEALLGVRGDKAAINLLGKDGRGVTTKDFYNQIIAGQKGDIAMVQAKDMMQTLAGDFELAKVKWTKFLIEFTDAVEPLLRKGIPLLSRFLTGLTKFMGSGFGKILARITLVALPLISTLFAFRAAILAATFALRGPGFRSVLRGGLAARAATRLNKGAITFVPGPGGGYRAGGGGVFMGGRGAGTGGGVNGTYLPRAARNYRYGPGLISGMGYANPAMRNSQRFHFMPAGAGRFGGLTMNKNGLWTVRSGRTFQWGGKTYKGGQMLGRNFSMPNMWYPGSPMRPGMNSNQAAGLMARYRARPAPYAAFGAPLRPYNSSRAAAFMAANGPPVARSTWYGRMGNRMGGAMRSRIPPNAWNRMSQFGRATGRTLNGISRVGGRMANFLTGPWGMAISLGMTFLPMIYDALTEKQREEAERYREDVDDTIGLFDEPLQPGDDKYPAFLAQPGMQQPNKTQVTVNVNGNRVYDEETEGDTEANVYDESDNW